MPEYKISIGMNKHTVPIGTVFLNSQWLNIKFFSLNNLNKILEFTSINVIEPETPSSKYPITTVIEDCLENQNKIEITLKTEESNGCLYYYKIIGILRDYTGIVNKRLGKLQIEIEGMEIIKILK